MWKVEKTAPASVKAAEVTGSAVEVEESAEPGGITQHHVLIHRKNESTDIGHHFVVLLDGLKATEVGLERRLLGITVIVGHLRRPLTLVSDIYDVLCDHSLL
jgi:hypothetical protein